MLCWQPFQFDAAWLIFALILHRALLSGGLVIWLDFVPVSGQFVNGGVKSGHWGGAKVGQFVECALGRVATNQQARSKAHWPSGRLFSCQVEGLAIRARL